LSDDSEEDRDLEKENYKISYIIGHVCSFSLSKLSNDSLKLLH
jgi:hypothetical protein